MNTTHVLPHTNQDPSARKYLLIMYILYGLFWVGFVITPIIALAMAYVKQGEWGDSIYRDHAEFLTRTFWLSVLGFIISIPLILLFGLGFLTMSLVGAWFAYRTAFGAWRIWQYEKVNPKAWLELP